MTNNTFNFQNSPVGAVSGSGTATNTGQSVHYDQRTVELLKTELDRAATTIEGLAIPEAESARQQMPSRTPKQTLTPALCDA